MNTSSRARAAGLCPADACCGRRGWTPSSVTSTATRSRRAGGGGSPRVRSLPPLAQSKDHLRRRGPASTEGGTTAVPPPPTTSLECSVGGASGDAGVNPRADERHDRHPSRAAPSVPGEWWQDDPLRATVELRCSIGMPRANAEMDVVDAPNAPALLGRTWKRHHRSRALVWKRFGNAMSEGAIVFETLWKRLV